MIQKQEESSTGPLFETNYGVIKSNYFGWKREVKPACKVWESEFPSDPHGREEFYRREGFVVFRKLLLEGELEDLRNETERFMRDYKRIPHVREGFDLEPMQDPTKLYPVFRKIGGICTLSEPFNRLMRHPTLLGFMHQIIGPEVCLFLDAILPKAARVGREKPWHQDQAFWKWRPHDVTIQTMTALDDCGLDNACLQVIPRTHHVFLKHGGREACLSLTPEQQGTASYLPLKAGDTVAFHSLLMHASEPNSSDKERRAVFIAYCPPTLKYYGTRVRPAGVPGVHPHELVPVTPLPTNR
jgi:phytanoyl-CoA hydroxylase